MQSCRKDRRATLQETMALGAQAIGASAPHGDRWATALGLGEDAHREIMRDRYGRLKESLVFRMDAHDIADPLSAFAAIDARDSTHEEGFAETEKGDGHSKRASWSQFFSEESLLQEINTDLDRLYPAGNEGFFQNENYLNILRQVLFVWCKLHPDVSYRQGMHDVVAVVFYAFLPEREPKPASSSANLDQSYDIRDIFGSKPDEPIHQHGERSRSRLPEHIEADTFLVFEAIMLYLKPFYEIVKTPARDKHSQQNPPTTDEPRLFSSPENDDPNELFGGPIQNEKKCKKPALHRLCYHVQYELLEQKDPQLFYHLQNLDIVPETYCLRWIRLLFAREFTFDALLHIWDGMIQDPSRPVVHYPNAADPDRLTDSYPQVDGCPMNDEDDAAWMGFPLLRYICVAKLLQLSPELRRSDNTGCLKLLMQSFNIDDIESPALHEQAAQELIRFAKILQNPTLEQQDGPQGVDVVKFGPGSLGVVLTAAKDPFGSRLAVKGFAHDPSDPSGIGQAQASGQVRVGDLLESINGVPIVGDTTEEVKRRIQLISRPLFIAFRHCSAVNEADDGGEVPLSLYSPQVEATSADGEVPADILVSAFLPGELCYANVSTNMQKFSLLQDGSCLSHYISGRFYITNYRCFFTRLLTPNEIDWQAPVLSISTVDGTDTLSPPPGASAMDHAQAVLGFTTVSEDSSHRRVVIRCKDAQSARLSFANYSDYSKLFKCLTCLAFPATLLDAFCFAYSPVLAPSEEVPFDLRREYKRIGLLDYPDRLRCIDQSLRYELCDTYPQYLIVPTDMSDVKIKAAAAFRSHNRLPVVSWLHRKNGATISRSAQPLVGLKSNRSAEDEQLVRLLCCSGNLHAFGRYVIMDARSQLAAVGNKAMGKGTEIPGNYRGAKLVFMNIDNIHTIRQSLQSLTAVFEPRKGASTEGDSSTSYYGKIESSGWLRHVRLVLKASVEMAQYVHNGVSVLTHCSDGWDRTAQMVSLAELMLDPYYRTLRGFQRLVEKEWCAFGHQFAARCGHARSDASNDQRSPVFLLWLDCVWQFVRQYPNECEFSESLLLALADHVYSCKYGTFMFDCERQRKEFFAKHRVHSVWSDINSHSERFTNALYAPSPDAPMLAPSTLSKNIKLWKGYFCRWDPTFVPPVPALQFY